MYRYGCNNHLLESKDQAHVKAALDAVETYCKGAFRAAFPVMLGDRGSEFLDFSKIERGLGAGQIRGETAFVTEAGGQARLLEHRLPRGIPPRTPAQ